jgi:(2Fe-2S) ferredoxin
MAHLVVCTNRRSEDDPLGGGCAERGEAVYGALRDLLQQRGLRPAVWLARSYCLGSCPKLGCAVMVVPGARSQDPSSRWLAEVTPGDAPELVEGVLKKP